ncbi:ABC transporter ATP-binding protein [Pandoraea anhela]|uniref:Leucine/isoleucine/valine transporter ATP-binding subunit n=1 Tax=Pandoraea anhela TaxID=2508295 RepID=A0A5E4X415_9BURK|nr:ABC transporter ATP-binding protein [Pandoraea anhela]VVE31010.1 leucine/isoleucine/valine transporter ATP-binding subunit [Pandoraea anhela]
MLTIDSLVCGYGAASVVHGLSMEVKAGETVALIGANGAGKTSTIQCIAGHLDVRAGSIRLDGKDISTMPPRHRVLEGIALSPEGRRLFSDMTVRENLIVGGYSRPRSHCSRNLERVLDLFPRLGERLTSITRTLSGGEQQMVSIGRALMAEPRLLLIDELSLGLTPKNVFICYEALFRLRTEGIAVVLVEQNLSNALAFSERAYVLDSGRLVWGGKSSVARDNPDLVASILGMGESSKPHDDIPSGVMHAARH